MATPFRTVPEPITTMPSGVPFIVGNEAAERFSFYGMRTILIPFMMKFMIDRAGQPDLMDANEANVWAHSFYSAVYFCPLLGALIADGLLGKYRTIIGLSLVYCLGHFTLALDDTRHGLFWGLTLIALGAGGIKPCVSAHVGDQFGERNQQLLPRVYGWFYFSINFGSFYSTLITPAILNRQGVFKTLIPENVRSAPLAFALPGVLMLIATIVFWLGRRRYAHIPPRGKAFLRETFSAEGLKVMLRLGALYVFVAFFWCLYDQTGTSWVQQAGKLNRYSPTLATAIKIFSLGLVSPDEMIAAEQVQAVNPLLIMVLIPTFNYGVYPLLGRFFTVTPMRKVGMGLVLTVVSFLAIYAIDLRIAAGEQPSVWWQLGAFVIITAAEVMVSITALEYSYTQAPPAMKSFVMSLYMLSVSLGNVITAVVNGLITVKLPAEAASLPEAQQELLREAAVRGTWVEHLKGPNYFLFFAGLLAVVTVVFVVASRRFHERTYIQGAGETAVA